MRSAATLLLALLPLAACESATGAAGPSDVRIRMGAAGSAPALAGARASLAADGPLVLAGDNGELTISDLRIVVAEFELKGDDDVNPCAAAGADDDCEDFDAGPLFVDLPLTGQSTVSTGALPAGTYKEFEFEIEDLDDNEENPAEAARIQALLQQIRAEFPEWPKDASMLVVGSFRPRTGGVLGAPAPFRVFIDAEVEIELALAPPLVIAPGDGARDLSVTFDPASVFRSGTRVVNLAQYDGRLIEWEMDRGFREDHSGRR